MYKIIKVHFRRGTRFRVKEFEIANLYLYADGDYELIGTNGYVVQRGRQKTQLVKREQKT